MMTETVSLRPLRLWPAVAIVIVQWLMRFIVPLVASDGAMIAVLSGLALGVMILVWWMFFSRAPWSERIAVLVAILLAIVVTRPLMHPSIQGGMMGMMFVMYLVPPTVSLALVAWALVSRRLSTGPRYAAMAVAVLIGCGVWTLARTNGLLGGDADLEWRWTPTAEELLLAKGGDEPKPLDAPAPAPAVVEAPKAVPPSAPAAAPTAAKTEPAAAAAKPDVAPASRPAVKRSEWPGFRGPGRDSVIHGVRINTDWSASPPVEIWRRQVGPGWSSFAVRGDLLYTQEQRGDDEIVACYRLSTGEPVWRHRDPVRFYESNGGAGPRGTPTIDGDRVYAFGATGILNALDARTGVVAWSRNVSSDTDRKVPDWGFSSSPLVIGDVVIVAASGTLAGYDAPTGRPRWTGPRLLGSYSSPHLATIDGVTQVMLLSGSGAASVAPDTGAVLWQHEWQAGGPPIVQPALTSDGGVLINGLASTGGAGTRRLAVAHDAEGWRVDERWTSNGLKPYFNDFVVHEGHAYGFDGNILACIDLRDGTRKWKGGRYGNGQLVLLPDQDVMLVLSEEGELALVGATPDQFKELGRFPVLDSKTWNHPAIVGDVLLVRNGEEMAAFRLALASPATATDSR